MLTSTRRAALLGALAGSGLPGSGLAGARSAAAQASPRAETRAMERLLAPWASRARPGVAVTVTLDGRRVFSQGFGAADLEHAAPITPATVFHAASVSKQFTAYATLLLAEAGRLSLDDEVQRHLPEMAGPARTLTLRQLLHHTNGLRDQYSLVAAAGWRDDDAITDEQLRRIVFRQSGLNFPPGSRFQYTNSGYFLLAQIVSRVSGQSLAAFARERIFQPLGMTSTQFYDDNEQIVPGRAYSYRPDGSGFRKANLNYATVGPTSLLTTSEDLCRWAGAFEGPLARAGALAAMGERAVLNDGSVHFYAMGQEFHAYKGLETWSHGGRDAGYRAFLLRVPAQRFSVAVLSNTAAFDAAGIAYAAADIYLGAHPGFVAPPTAPPARPDAARLAGYAGAYEVFPGQILVLTTDGADLFAAWLDGVQTTRLKPLSPTGFLLDADANIGLEFDPAETGRAGGLKYRIGLNGALDAPRVDLRPFDQTATNLSDYVGRYHCPDLAADYELLLDGGRLIARHLRLADIALKPYQPDLFHSFQAFFGRAEFQRDAAGAVRRMVVSGAVAEGLVFERLA